VATNDVEDLDLEELTDQLDDEDLEPRQRHTLAEVRAALRRIKGKLERAAGRDEEQREQAWTAAGIPARIRSLMGEVDPRDSDALAARWPSCRATASRGTAAPTWPPDKPGKPPSRQPSKPARPPLAAWHRRRGRPAGHRP
jgi:hypothetical protein